MGTIASVARVATITPTAGAPFPVNELFVFYYHIPTRELRFITFGLGNMNPLKRDSQGTVKDGSGNIVLGYYNNTISPLAATYDPYTDTVSLTFYSCNWGMSHFDIMGY
jgi:hypothetical protein